MPTLIGRFLSLYPIFLAVALDSVVATAYVVGLQVRSMTEDFRGSLEYLG